MRKYKVIMRLSSSKVVLCIEHFDTYDEAVEYVEELRADDLKYGAIDDYEYEIIDLNKQGGNEQ